MMCLGRLSNHVNSEGKTPMQLFASRNEKLFSDAKEWVKTTAENCSVIVVLIATVAFTATYTLPGGLNSQTGTPLLLKEPLFITFAISNILALLCSLTSLLIWITILIKPFVLRDFKVLIPGRLMMGFTFLIISISMMMLAFSATSVLMIHNKHQRTKSWFYVVAVLIFTIFAFSYMPLYLALLGTFRYMLFRIDPILPRYTGFSLAFMSLFERFKRPVYSFGKFIANIFNETRNTNGV